MYAFYADESGFSKSNKFEDNQPILVVAGILVDSAKLKKALDVFDTILYAVNSKLSFPVKELKFSDIRNKNPYRIDLPTVEERADLLHWIFTQFQSEINFKLFYCAVDNDVFFKIQRGEATLRNQLKHPYLCAAYKVLSQLDRNQAFLKNNEGNTFVILDEQNQFQDKIEQLIESPIHRTDFNEIFDTTYFGKSQYSKLIQIADLSAGLIRYYLLRRQEGVADYWFERMESILENLKPNIIHNECFDKPLLDVYQQFELHL
jgi:hypothetical protein